MIEHHALAATPHNKTKATPVGNKLAQVSTPDFCWIRGTKDEAHPPGDIDDDGFGPHCEPGNAIRGSVLPQSSTPDFFVAFFCMRRRVVGTFSRGRANERQYKSNPSPTFPDSHPRRGLSRDSTGHLALVSSSDRRGVSLLVERRLWLVWMAAYLGIASLIVYPVVAVSSNTDSVVPKRDRTGSFTSSIRSSVVQEQLEQATECVVSLSVKRRGQKHRDGTRTSVDWGFC